jgi:hypothetical protein|tara:strand:- start:4853 stop:5101 length:249 start_codon:yes stop_codon:yes gene_type:complete
MNLRQVLIDAARSHFAGHINKHIANIEVLLNNPVGIGEHQDIQESIEIELGHIADYHDKLEMLTKFFMQKKGEDNVEHTEEE